MTEPLLPVPPHAFDEPSAGLARRRPLPILPRHVRLEVRLAPDVPRVLGRVSHRVTGLHPEVRRITFDAADLTVESVTIGGESQRFHQNATAVEVTLNTPLLAGETIEIVLDYEASPSVGIYWVGPTPDQPLRRPQIWTQGAMEDHHHWFPCFDAPEHMVTTEVLATVPNGLTALSNGALVGRTPATIPGHTTWHWHMARPHALYLLTLVVDTTVEVSDEAPGVTLHHYVPPGHEADARVLFERMPAMIKYFADTTAQPYPFGRYGHVFLQDFMWGGMENTTLTSLTDQVLVAGQHRDEEDVERLFAHELAHQWFGDLIAPRGWPEIWLNESFATYFEILCMRALNGEDDFVRRLVQERDSYLAEARTRYARAVVTRKYAHPYVLFDRHAYEKGALVLHTLRDQLGDTTFFEGVRLYVSRCGGQAAETAELRRAFEDASGADLTDFFEDMVYGAAHPHVAVRWAFQPATGLELELLRKDETKQSLTVPVEVGFADAPPVRRRVTLAPGARQLVLDVGRTPLYVAVDPDSACLVELDESAEDDAVLRARLRASGVGIALRARTCRLLADRGSPANRAALVQCLANDLSATTRAEAARALGEHRHPQARDALLATLETDRSWRVRAAAARAVGLGADDHLVPILDKHLGSEESHRVRCGLLRALGDIVGEASRAVLRRELDTSSPRECVAAAAVSALAAHEDAATLDELLRRTERTYHRAIRTAALAGLSRVAQAHTQDKLLLRKVRLHVESNLFDPTFSVRAAAIDALKDLGDTAAVPSLERAHGAEAYGLLRRSIREALGVLTTASAGSTPPKKVAP